MLWFIVGGIAALTTLVVAGNAAEEDVRVHKNVIRKKQMNNSKVRRDNAALKSMKRNLIKERNNMKLLLGELNTINAPIVRRKSSKKGQLKNNY